MNDKDFNDFIKEITQEYGLSESQVKDLKIEFKDIAESMDIVDKVNLYPYVEMVLSDIGVIANIPTDKMTADYATQRQIDEFESGYTDALEEGAIEDAKAFAELSAKQREKSFPLKKIISGLQKNVDQAGIRAAIDLGLDYGGTVNNPGGKGYLVVREGKNIFDLKDYQESGKWIEIDSSNYPERTTANARNADGTVWFGSISKESRIVLRNTPGSIDAMRGGDLGNPFYYQGGGPDAIVKISEGSEDANIKKVVELHKTWLETGAVPDGLSDEKIKKLADMRKKQLNVIDNLDVSYKLGYYKPEAPVSHAKTLRDFIDKRRGFDDSRGYGATKTGSGDSPWIENPTSAQLRQWIIDNDIKILNVAGNRPEKDGSLDIGRKAYKILMKAIEPVLEVDIKHPHPLSPMMETPFEWEGREYRSVEHAYQTNKAGEFHQETYDKYKNSPKDFNKQVVKITGPPIQDFEYSEKLYENLYVESALDSRNPFRLESLKNMPESVKITHSVGSDWWQKNFGNVIRRVQTKLLTETKKSIPQVIEVGDRWDRWSVENDKEHTYIFGDNTKDRKRNYIPKNTTAQGPAGQAVIRGLDNAIGIDTRKSTSLDFTDADFEEYVRHVDEQIEEAISRGLPIKISSGWLAPTGNAGGMKDAIKLRDYVNNRLNELKSGKQPLNYDRIQAMGIKENRVVVNDLDKAKLEAFKNKFKGLTSEEIRLVTANLPQAEKDFLNQNYKLLGLTPEQKQGLTESSRPKAVVDQREIAHQEMVDQETPVDKGFVRSSQIADPIEGSLIDGIEWAHYQNNRPANIVGWLRVGSINDSLKNMEKIDNLGKNYREGTINDLVSIQKGMKTGHTIPASLASKEYDPTVETKTDVKTKTPAAGELHDVKETMTSADNWKVGDSVIIAGDTKFHTDPKYNGKATPLFAEITEIIDFPEGWATDSEFIAKASDAMGMSEQGFFMRHNPQKFAPGSKLVIFNYLKGKDDIKEPVVWNPDYSQARGGQAGPKPPGMAFTGTETPDARILGGPFDELLETAEFAAASHGFDHGKAAELGELLKKIGPMVGAGALATGATALRALDYGEYAYGWMAEGVGNALIKSKIPGGSLVAQALGQTSKKAVITAASPGVIDDLLSASVGPKGKYTKAAGLGARRLPATGTVGAVGEYEKWNFLYGLASGIILSLIETMGIVGRDTYGETSIRNALGDEYYEWAQNNGAIDMVGPWPLIDSLEEAEDLGILMPGTVDSYINWTNEKWVNVLYKFLGTEGAEEMEDIGTVWREGRAPRNWFTELDKALGVDNKMGILGDIPIPQTGLMPAVERSPIVTGLEIPFEKWFIPKASRWWNNLGEERPSGIEDYRYDVTGDVEELYNMTGDINMNAAVSSSNNWSGAMFGSDD